MKRACKYIYLAVSLLLVSSCSEPILFQKEYELSDAQWAYNKAFEFDFESKDSLKPYDLIINLQYGTNYAYSNLFLFVDVEAPDQKTYTDTIECLLSDYQGRFYGKVSGEEVKQNLLYRHNINFPEEGKYRIRFQQAMRDTLLGNVQKVGLTIQESKLK